MRVALVCPYSWSVPGGVQTHVLGLAAALRRAGLGVDVFGPAEPGNAPDGIVPLGRPVGIPDNGSTVRVAIGPDAIGATIRALGRHRYDVVHLHEPAIPAVCLAAVLTAPGALVGTFHMHAASPRWYRPFGPLIRRALGRLDERIAVSEAARRHVSRSCPGDYRIVPNGIDHAPGGSGRRSGTLVAFVGRAEPRKGLPVLLAAVALLPAHVHVELAGVSEAELARAGGDHPALHGRVTALGRVSDGVRADLLARADVLCAPSLRGESFGIVLLEGMAAGLPVVASGIPGYADVLADGCGVTVPPADPQALADALTRVLGDEELRDRLVKRGLRATRRLAWDRVATEIAGVYERALARFALRQRRRRPRAVRPAAAR